MIAQHDRTNSGVLQYSDFETLMKPRVLEHIFSEEDEVEKLRLAFKEADHNLSGSLDINEFYCVLISYGMQISKDQLADLMMEFDVDRSGLLDIDEFVSVLTGSDDFDFSESKNKDTYN